MCRILLIINRIKNSTIINNFLKQSNTPKNTPFINCSRDYDINMDGYGFGWYKKNRWNIQNKFYYYKSKNNYFNDYNKYIMNTLNDKTIILGHIRAITKDDKPNYHNSHPFLYNNTLWAHNGSIDTKSIDTGSIDTKSIEIKGTTDSEYMHKLFVKNLIKNNYNYEKNILIYTIKHFFKKLSNKDTANIVYMDQQYIWVSRYYKETKTDPLSLYYDNSNGIIVSSEPVTETFRVFPENNVFVFNHNGDIVDTINI